MDFSTYISHVPEGNTPISPFQLVCDKERFTHSDFEAFLYSKLYSNIDIILIGETYKTVVKDDVIGFVYRFLDFHYGQYTGQKESFLYFVERAIGLSEAWHQIHVVEENKRIIDNYIKGWVILKKKELKEQRVQKEHLNNKAAPSAIKGNQVSFMWQGKQGEIDTLFYLLIKDGSLSEGTDITNFRNLFNGKPISSIKPIQWLKKKNLLAYLLDQLYEKGKFPEDTKLWSIATSCFNGAKSLKQLKTNYTNNKNYKPKGFSSIDKIIDGIE